MVTVPLTQDRQGSRHRNCPSAGTGRSAAKDHQRQSGPGALRNGIFLDLSGTESVLQKKPTLEECDEAQPALNNIGAAEMV
jgi:hypothetical protein